MAAPATTPPITPGFAPNRPGRLAPAASIRLRVAVAVTDSASMPARSVDVDGRRSGDGRCWWCGVGGGVVVWGGAWLAAVVAGGRVSGGVGDWLRAAGRLVSSPGDPARAWGERASGLPGPVVYWACTAAVAFVAGLVVAGVVWVWRRWSTPSRSRFGVPVDARVARPRDVRPLVVAGSLPPTGRLLLGRMAPHGPLLATEDRERHPARTPACRAGAGGPGFGRVDRSDTVGQDGAGVGGDHRLGRPRRRPVGETGPVRRDGGCPCRAGRVGGVRSRRRDRVADGSVDAAAGRDHDVGGAAGRAGVGPGDPPPRRHRRGLLGLPRRDVDVSAYMSLAGLSQLLPGKDGAVREPLTIGRLASWAYMHVGITDPTANELVRLGLDETRAVGGAAARQGRDDQADGLRR